MSEICNRALQRRHSYYFLDFYILNKLEPYVRINEYRA